MDDDTDTAEHTKPVIVGEVVYDPVFGIAVVLVEINELGAAVWEMMDSHEGDGMKEVMENGN